MGIDTTNCNVPLTASLHSLGLLTVRPPPGQLENLVASYSISPASPEDVSSRGHGLPPLCSCGWATTIDDFLSAMLFPVLLVVYVDFDGIFLLMILILPKIIRKQGSLLSYSCLWDVQI